MQFSACLRMNVKWVMFSLMCRCKCSTCITCVDSWHPIGLCVVFCSSPSKKRKSATSTSSRGSPSPSSPPHRTLLSHVSLSLFLLPRLAKTRPSIANCDLNHDFPEPTAVSLPSLHYHTLLLDLSTDDAPSSCDTFKGFARFSDGRGPFPTSCTMVSSQYTFYHTAPSASVAFDGGGPTTYLKTMSSDTSNKRSIYFPLRHCSFAYSTQVGSREFSKIRSVLSHTKSCSRNGEKAFLDENYDWLGLINQARVHVVNGWSALFLFWILTVLFFLLSYHPPCPSHFVLFLPFVDHLPSAW